MTNIPKSILFAALLSLCCVSSALADDSTTSVNQQRFKPYDYFTFRYVVFEVKSSADLSDYPSFILNNINSDDKFAMKSTPDDFIENLKKSEPKRTFKIIMSGSVPVANGDTGPSDINEGPILGDPLKTILRDRITANQIGADTIILTSHGNISTQVRSSSDIGGGYDWNGHNDNIMIGKSYIWGAQHKPDGTIITFAFCILPGNSDNSATAWASKKIKHTSVAKLPNN